MKSFLVLILLFFSVPSFAVDMGYYQCSAQEQDNEELYFHDFEITGDSITFYEGEVPDVEYVIGRESDGYKDLVLDQDNDDFGMYYFKYNFYMDKNGEDLKFVYKTKHIDSEATVESVSTISQLDEETVQIVEVYTIDDEVDVKIVSVCTLAED